MNLLRTLLCATILGFPLAAEEFLRPLPTLDQVRRLTADKFPGADAVLILHEVSRKVSWETLFYRGNDMRAPQTTIAVVKIVKLFNEAAVERYGTFEYTYLDLFGSDFKSGFDMRVRVQKENGDVLEVDKDLVERAELGKTSRGRSFAKHVVLKIPNLAVGDVLQIEYVHAEPLASFSGGQHSFQGQDPVLYSNFYLTVSENSVPSFRPSRPGVIPDPKIIDLADNSGTGKTWFWSLQNLSGISPESFSPPTLTRALTIFFTVRDEEEDTDIGETWNDLVEKFWKSQTLLKDRIKEDELHKLGFDAIPKSVSIILADSLYTVLRKSIRSTEYSSVNPGNRRNLGELLEEESGDPSELAVMFYRILLTWKMDPHLIFIRDFERGPYDKALPALWWFNRLGVSLTVDSVEHVYDFQSDQPTRYQQPWRLDGTQVVVVDSGKFAERILAVPSTSDDHSTTEHHRLTISPEFRVIDSMSIQMTGDAARTRKAAWSDLEEAEIQESVRKLSKELVMSDVRSLRIDTSASDGNVRIEVTGPSRTVIVQADSLLFVKPVAHFIRSFRERFSTPARTSDIAFHLPRQYVATWQIPIPEGFRVRSLPTAVQSTSSTKLAGEVKYSDQGAFVEVVARLRVPSMTLPSSMYVPLVKYIERIVEMSERDVIFVHTR